MGLVPFATEEVYVSAQPNSRSDTRDAPAWSADSPATPAEFGEAALADAVGLEPVGVIGFADYGVTEPGPARRGFFHHSRLRWLSVISSLLALVVGEQINANAGLGFMLTAAQQFLENNIIMVCLIVYAILGLIAEALVRTVERRVLAWRPEFVQ
jgi:hypothetical protein